MSFSRIGYAEIFIVLTFLLMTVGSIYLLVHVIKLVTKGNNRTLEKRMETLEKEVRDLKDRRR